MIRKLKNFFHHLKARLVAWYFGSPAKKLKIIGITGTDGKTTTTFLIYHILKESGKKVSMISTVGAVIGGRKYDIGLHVTSPDAIDMQRYLKKASENGDEYFVLEVTSHATDQHRVEGITFEVGVLTNITHEHLDYHHTYEHYLETKVKLLLHSRKVVINRDDQSYKLVQKELKETEKDFLTYGLIHDANFSLDLSQKLSLNLTEFNNYNYLAAYSVCRLLAISDQTIFEAMKTFQLPAGRFETVYKKDFTVIVDFAHTPNALHEVLRAIKKNVLKNGRLIHVFGAPGLRDASKRPLMGEASGTYSDIVILTGDDYRTEDPSHIAEQIAEGLRKKGYTQRNSEILDETKGNVFTIITDREQAIKKSLQLAKKDDVVVLTGIGHQRSLARGKAEYPWDEKKVVRSLIKNLN